MSSTDGVHNWAVRAFQAWPLLTFGAKQRHIFTYEELGEHLGLMSVTVGEALGPIYRYCLSNGLPLLNLIVVKKHSGKPENEEFNNYDIPAEQAKVFLHNWLNEDNHAHSVPAIETLQTFTKGASAAKQAT